MRIILDEEKDDCYGYWICELCNNRFFGGGPAIHKKGCKSNNYESCTYYCTKREIEVAKYCAKEYGNNNATIPLGPISVNLLIENGLL